MDQRVARELLDCTVSVRCHNGDEHHGTLLSATGTSMWIVDDTDTDQFVAINSVSEIRSV